MNKDIQIIESPIENIDNFELIINEAEKRIDYIQKCIDYSIKVTSINDWVIFNGIPFLEFDGAQKIANIFGICWSEIDLKEEKKTDENGKYVSFWGKAKLWFAKYPDRKIEILGGCTSRDKFFGIINGQLKELKDIDLLNVKKKAIANILGRGIKALLGLNGLTLEHLKASGLDLENIASVTHKTGKKGGTSKDIVKAELAEKIKCVCLYMANGDKKKAADYYHNSPGYADFKYKDDKTGEEKEYKAKEPEKLTQKHAEKIWKKLEKECEKLNIDWSVAIEEYGKKGE